MKKPTRILALDPGKTNMGIAVIEHSSSKNKFVPIDSAIMTSPLDNLNSDFKESLDEFFEEIEEWVVKHKPDALIAERFQARGRTGNTGELVSFMLGALTVKYKHLPIRFVNAGMWKNEFNRKVTKLDTVYKWCRTPPHMLDAALIGVYGLVHGLDLKTKSGEMLVPNILEFVTTLEKNSREPLINRKHERPKK